MGTYSKVKSINNSLNNIKTSLINKGYSPSGNITTYVTAINNIPTPVPVINREVANGVCKMPTASFTFNLPSGAIDLGNTALNYAFWFSTGLTSVNFSNLTNVSGAGALENAFGYCTNLTTISFPSLTSAVSSYNGNFKNMLYKTTGCTVHFPSNLQNIIGGWSNVTGGFGGTNTTVLFDLPATT